MTEEESIIHKKQCPKCGYEWFPRVKDPKRCPKCQKWL